MYQLYEWCVFALFIYRLNEYINSAVFSLYSETPVFSTSFTIKTVCVHIHHLPLNIDFFFKQIISFTFIFKSMLT